ncbi:MAG: hypothetical protein IJU41_01795, partial [Clostridia bacterium]|nr:hypothetical protein [Clostridia bacterium]
MRSIEAGGVKRKLFSALLWLFALLPLRRLRRCFVSQNSTSCGLPQLASAVSLRLGHGAALTIPRMVIH